MRPIEIEAVLEVSKHLLDLSEALHKLAAVSLHHMKQEGATRGASGDLGERAAAGPRPALYVVR